MPYTASYKDALFLWISVNGTHTYVYIQRCYRRRRRRRPRHHRNVLCSSHN